MCARGRLVLFVHTHQGIWHKLHSSSIAKVEIAVLYGSDDVIGGSLPLLTSRGFAMISMSVCFAESETASSVKHAVLSRLQLTGCLSTRLKLVLSILGSFFLALCPTRFNNGSPFYVTYSKETLCGSAQRWLGVFQRGVCIPSKNYALRVFSP